MNTHYCEQSNCPSHEHRFEQCPGSPFRCGTPIIHKVASRPNKPAHGGFIPSRTPFYPLKRRPLNG